MANKETFESRQRYNADAIAFINKLLVPLIPAILLVFLLYPLGILHAARNNTLAYIIFNIAIGTVCGIKVWQRKYNKATTRDIELLVTGLIVVTGTSLLLFVTGFQHPIIVFWIIAIIIAFLNFGNRGYVIVALITLILTVTDIMLQPASSDKLSYSILTIMYGATLNVVAFVLIRVLNLTAKSERNLEKTRKRETKQRDRLQAVVNNMAEALISVNARGVIDLQNATALSVLDTNESLIGRHIDEVFQLTDGEKKVVKADELLRDKHKVLFRDDLQHNLGADDLISLSLLITPIQGDFRGKGSKNEKGFVIIFRDITKQKSLDEERDEFISVASHELRTPVAVAEGSIDNLMLMQQKGAQPELIIETAKTAHDHIAFLASIINDLGTLSRAERGVSDALEEIDLTVLCQSLCEKFVGQAKEKGLELKLDIAPGLPHVMQSRLYVEEILQNLMTNALKYTEAGSITLHALPTENGVECAVSDTGIGISASDQRKIFDKFFRSEDYRTRKTGGIGLGLYVVQKLAKKIGAEIRLTSHINHGSRFSLLIPASKKDETAE